MPIGDEGMRNQRANWAPRPSWECIAAVSNAPATSSAITVFVSYARGDDEPFVARLAGDLRVAGFDVWFDRADMPSRGLAFHQEIRDTIAARARLVLVIGPKAVASDYVRQEWQFAWRE